VPSRTRLALTQTMPILIIIVMKPRLLVPFAAMASVLAATACNADATASGGRQQVIASFYPLEFAARQVGGDRATVENLVKPGAEPHDFELTAAQIAKVGEADLVVYLKDFQPAVDDAVVNQAAGKALDTGAVQKLRDGFVPLEDGVLHEDEKGQDPHLWLDPLRYAAVSDAIATRLSSADPANKSGYEASAKDLRERLEALDAEYSRGLQTCERREFVVSHNAFGYLADRYKLTQQPIAGLSPDAEPSPARLAEITRFARKHDVKTVFFETSASPALARTLAAEIGADVKVLDPVEGKPESGDYFSAMRENLTALRAALGCS
jgi:zinc transport system substrate-binding protein